MASDNIIDVSESDFEYQVIAYSAQVPVVVDFWAEWCVPCRTLSPVLERLTDEAGGSFRLAKVNVDENPNLALRYAVRSIPMVKAFRHGNVVSEFVGIQPELRLREFFRAIAPSPADLALEKGYSLLLEQDWMGAEKAYRQALEYTPSHPAALLGLARCLLAQNHPDEAEKILASFPTSRELPSANGLRPLATALLRIRNEAPSSDDPLEAAYNHALRLVARGNLPAAMDGLLDVLRQDKRYRNGEVRQVLLAILDIQGETSLTRQYRNELASILF
jgi:putative thioredoxin